ncbi:MAG: hypothetical protein ACD_73C00083G0002 [uncultured bacterium]|nr:MAG: hypothetical protein ACD_73C00083G0002 [uncultured bacterium]
MTHEKKVLIKRYQNRKLYDTRNSTYVTLDDIAKMIRAGEDVYIQDNSKHDDLTAVTLTQIIFEEGKKNKFTLPLTTLKKIIQDGGGSIRDFFEKTIDTGVDQLTKAKEGAEQVIDKVKEVLTPDAEGNILQEVLLKTQDFSKKIDEKIKSTVESVTHVTALQNEVKNLRKKIAILEKKLTDYEK